jgi:PAS domain S-box-containing protein
VADAGVARAAHLGTLSSGEALLLLGSWGLVCMLAVAVWSLGARLGQVREEQRLYREMVESANSIVLRLDMGGTVTYANHHALEVFGYDWHELVGRDLRETLLPPGDADTFPHAWEKLAEAPGRYAAHENDNRRKDGSVLRVAWSNRVLRSRSGQSLGVVSIGNNVTELRRQQRALSRLKPALDQAPDGVVVMDLDGVVEYANPPWGRWCRCSTGWARPTPDGKPWPSGCAPGAPLPGSCSALWAGRSSTAGSRPPWCATRTTVP